MNTAATYAPRTAHPIERFARAHHRTLERWLIKHFSRQLNAEDIGDVLGETYRAALETPETATFEPERMSAWAYQVARFRAIGFIRARTGRASASDSQGPPGHDRPRRVVISLDQLAPSSPEIDAATDDAPLARFASDSAYAELADMLSDQARAEEARRVTDALLRLPDDQREALQYVHMDGLTVRGAAELLGTSKSTFDRIYRRALSRLHALCAIEQSADCAQARALMQPKAALAVELVGWRDAHIEGCFACQVAAGRRVKIALPLLPVIADRPSLFGRIGDRVSQLLSRGDAMPTEAVAAGLGTASAGGTVAGSTLLGGAAAKATACVVTAVCAAGAVTVPAVVSHHHDEEPRTGTVAAKVEATATPRATFTPAPAVTPVATTVASTSLTGDDAARRAANTEAAADAERARKRRAARAKAAKARAVKAKAGTGAEFSPESFRPEATPAPNTPRANAASGTTTSTPSTTSSSITKSSSRSTSSFSEEFRP